MCGENEPLLVIAWQISAVRTFREIEFVLLPVEWKHNKKA